MRSLVAVIVAAAAAAGSLQAQSLAARVVASDGQVQVIYPSRPSACGDGAAFMRDVLGTSWYEGDNQWRRPCVHGPARVVATVIGGEVTRLRVYVGPVPASDARTIDASAADASAWLARLVSTADTRVAQDAVVPLVLADAADPWEMLVGVARDDQRPMSVRRTALMWAGNGVIRHLGIDGARDDSDDDAMRRQAVFVLSQRSRSESTPDLVDVARSSKHASARRDAIFWLSQTGDPQTVADLYAALLRSR